MSIKTLKIDLATYQAELKQAQSELDNFEYSITEGEYDQIIDDTELTVTVCGMDFSPSEVLKKLDPTAYLCGKSDYEGSCDLECLYEYRDLQEKVSDLEIEIESLQDQINELESEK